MRRLQTDYDFQQKLGDDIEFRLIVAGNPPPNIVWLDSRGKEIPSSRNDGKNETRLTKLKIYNITSDDLGEYKMRANNGHHQKEAIFRLLVTG